MTWELVQAGNRASKTRRYLQWWENKQEQDAVDLCVYRTHMTALFWLFFGGGGWLGHCLLIQGRLRKPRAHPPAFWRAMILQRYGIPYAVRTDRCATQVHEASLGRSPHKNCKNDLDDQT